MGRIVERHTIRNTIVTGSFTLPVMAVLALLLWVLPDVADWRQWAGLGMTGLTAYLIMELDTRNALLRIRSRMMSATYLLLMTVCSMLHAWDTGMIAACCFVLSYHTLFASYQQRRAEGYVFHAFLFAGIGSMFFPPMAVTVLGYYFCLLLPLRGFNWRTFMAGLLGFLVPYWGYAAYAVWLNRLDEAFRLLQERFAFGMPDYSALGTSELLTAGTLLFFSIPAFIHFFHTAYNDKIRTRMLFYCITTQQVLLTAGLVLLPGFFDDVMRLFLLNTSLLMAHYYALAKGRGFHIWFNMSLAAFIVLGVYNYCFA